MKVKEPDKHSLNSEKLFTVSEYIKIVNTELKSLVAKIIGEVSEVNVWSSGHVYFSLKDENEEGVINCIIWKSRYQIYGIELKEGMKIIAAGYPEVYPRSGKLSFIAEVIEIAGEGALKKQYEKLKKKLAGEGLFDKERKRPVPKYSQRIGLITSKQGAVLADFLNNLGKFGFKIKMVDSRVEGQAAVPDLLKALKSFKKQDIDVLVIMRGGGSLESLIGFNNEILAREVASFPVPVIAALGHHKDIPLVALAADDMVSTPTAAANLLSSSWEQVHLLLENYKENIFNAFDNSIRDIYSLFNQVWDRSIILGFKSMLSSVVQRLTYVQKIVESNNPERQLKLGYSIARCSGKIIRSIKNVKIGKNINVEVVDGSITSKVNSINKISKNKNEQRKSTK